MCVVTSECVLGTGASLWGEGVWGGGVTPPKSFKNRENSGKLKVVWLLAHPIKFVQFYRISIFGRFNEHTACPPPQSKWFRDAPDWVWVCKWCGLISSVCGVLLCHNIKLDYLLTIPIFFTVPLEKVPRPDNGRSYIGRSPT